MPVPTNVTPGFANTFSSTSLIYQPIVTPRLVQIISISLADLLQQLFNTFANPYIQIPPIKVPNEMLPATIVAQFIKI